MIRRRFSNMMYKIRGYRPSEKLTVEDPRSVTCQIVQNLFLQVLSVRERKKNRYI